MVIRLASCDKLFSECGASTRASACCSSRLRQRTIDLQVFMLKLSSIKSTMKLTFILDISENLNVFEYVKKNRRLLHR